MINQKEAASSKLFKHKEFNLEKLGIGGLSAEFTDNFVEHLLQGCFLTLLASKYGTYRIFLPSTMDDLFAKN